MKNGQISYDVLNVVLAYGVNEDGPWEFRCTPMFQHCWTKAKAYALEHFGKTLYIRPGWNVYRPGPIQVQARERACAAGNCRGAAVPYTSSHGGVWIDQNGKAHDCLAVDVDPNGLEWWQVDEAMEHAGFVAGLITAAISGIPGGEPWHYILFIAFDPAPAPVPATTLEGSAMHVGKVINVLPPTYGYTTNGKPTDPNLGTLMVCQVGGGFGKIGGPFRQNVRGVVAKDQAGDPEPIATYTAYDFGTLDANWYLANRKDANGKPIA